MFRRRQDEEDPFAALKDAAERGSATVTGGSPEVVRPPRDAASTAQVSGVPGGPDVHDGSGAMPGTPPDRRGSNGFLILLTVVLSFAGAGAAVWASQRDAPSGPDAARADGGSAVVGDPSGSEAIDPPADAEPPVSGQEKPSADYDLLRPATFKQALNAIDRSLRPGERVWLVRVARDRINANTRLRDGRQRLIDVDDALEVATTVAGEAGDRSALDLASIDPHGPSRAVRKAAALGGFPTSKLDYLVLLSPTYPGDVADWSLFFDGVSERNQHWNADLAGGAVHRPGETSRSDSRTDSLTIRTDSGTTTLTGADARRVNACIQRAGTDGRKIQECLP